MHWLVFMPSGRRVKVPHGTTVLEGARRVGIEIEATCGGDQTCGTCKIEPIYGNFASHSLISAPANLSPRTSQEEQYVEANERLACAAEIMGDILIRVPETSLVGQSTILKYIRGQEVPLLPAVRQIPIQLPPAKLGGRATLERLQAELDISISIDPLIIRSLDKPATVTIWRNRKIICVDQGEPYGLAIDIGSTTLAAYLCHLQTGETLATKTLLNPQVRYGEDLISRISYAMYDPENTQHLHQAIIEALNHLCRDIVITAGVNAHDIVDVVLVGNTVMHHLVLGINPHKLGQLPFTLTIDSSLDIQARDVGLHVIHPGAMVHMLPCIAGYVGADNVAVLLAEYDKLIDDDVTLVVDIGTNAEILLGAYGKVHVTSSPTGPAFEGAQIACGQRAVAGAIEQVRVHNDSVQYKVIGNEYWSDQTNTLNPTGICGSGIIETVAELLSAGIIDKSGRFIREKKFVLAIRSDGREIFITQKDVRAIQLAKGALYTGIRLLMEKAGVQHIDNIRLAGGFGNHISPQHAIQIGLIPFCEDVKPIGNAAGEGARLALLNTEKRAHAEQLARTIQYLETAAMPEFKQVFFESLVF